MDGVMTRKELVIIFTRLFTLSFDTEQQSIFQNFFKNLPCKAKYLLEQKINVTLSQSNEVNIFPIHILI